MHRRAILVFAFLAALPVTAPAVEVDRVNRYDLEVANYGAGQGPASGRLSVIFTGNDDKLSVVVVDHDNLFAAGYPVDVDAVIHFTEFDTLVVLGHTRGADSEDVLIVFYGPLNTLFPGQLEVSVGSYYWRAEP